MKIEYEKINNNESTYIKSECVFKFKIVNSILKSHYKQLANMSMLFNTIDRNVGFIRKNHEKDFIELIAIVEKSDNKICEASHKKSAAKYKNKKEEKYKSKKEECEHEDLGSLGYKHGDTVICPMCGKSCEVW